MIGAAARKIVLVLGATVAAVAIVGAAWVQLQLRRAAHEEVQLWRDFDERGARLRADLAAHGDELLADQRALAAVPLLSPRVTDRDAEPLIGPRVRWRLAGGEATRPTTLSGELLDPEIYRRLGEDWMRAGPELWRGVDLDWMTRLAQYDRWDVDRNAAAPEEDGWTDPEPLTADLLAWAKLRLAKGVHERALAPALAEVQELARLCLTVERYGTQIAAIGILQAARQVVDREAPELSDRAVSQVTIDRLQRAVPAAHALARLETPAAYEADLARVVVGRCSALHDGLRYALVVRGLLRAARPDEFARMDRLLAATPECRLAGVRRRWAVPDGERAPGWLSRAIERRNGELLLSESELDWFRGYRKAGR